MSNQKNNTGANLEFEDNLWAVTDKLHGNMDVTIRRNLETKGYDR